MKNATMSFRRLSALSALALVALAGAGSASAASRQERLAQELQQRFILADVNGDGYLTAAEALGKMPFVYSHFAVIDKDKNGLVSLDDIRSYIVSQAANHPMLLR